MDDLVLHIGLMKSGTTSVQHALYDSRQELRARGIEYVDLGQFNQMLAFVPLLNADPHARDRYHEGLRVHLAQATTDFEALWDMLVTHVRASTADRVILSAENLVYAGVDTIKLLVRTFSPRPVHVVVTHRRPSRMVPSNYQQQGRIAMVGGFDAWARRELTLLAAEVPSGTLSSLRLWDLAALWDRHAARVELIHVGDDVDIGFGDMWQSLTGLEGRPPNGSSALKNASMPAELVEAMQRYFARGQKRTVADVREIVHRAQRSYLGEVGTQAYRWQLVEPIRAWLDRGYEDPEADWGTFASMVAEAPRVGELVPLRPGAFDEHVEQALREVERAARAVTLRSSYRSMRARLRSIT